jgi:hypothetical protein
MKKLQKTGRRIDDTRGITGKVQKEMYYIISLHKVDNMLCVVILTNMYCSLN